MKNNYLYLLLITCFIFSSCDNTLNLFAEEKEVPVVYGLISTTETTQYIRIEKGFLDENIPANELAQNSDNLYYDQIDAHILNHRNNKEFPLYKVNAEDEGYQRENGFFAKSPNYVYKFEIGNNDFQPGDELTIKIITVDAENPITADVKLLSEVYLNKPSHDVSFGFIPDSDFSIRWFTYAQSENPPVIWDVNLYFNYKEADLSLPEPEWETKQITWNLFKNVGNETESNDVIEKMDGIEFYNFLAKNLEANPNVARQFLDFDVEIISGDSHLKRYIEVLNANTGITSSQPTPNYSNLSRGIGLLAARNIQYFEKFFITEKTSETLKSNDLTKDLNFK